ncbi:MAG TPA: TonB-dependent receptor [Pyrinomonadaceae bacterium]
MRRKSFFKWMILSIISTLIMMWLYGTSSLEVVHATAEKRGRITQGSLQALDENGKFAGLCPLKHTAVKAEIAGFLSRVTVTQEFENGFQEKIEALYTFPLPQDAAVDEMTMLVGNRTVKGKIMRREEAQAVYTEAKSKGQAAALLDQERPNIFRQSVANISPGERITVIISYVETLKYDNGTYEFVFPMVVGPRYIPGDTRDVPDEQTPETKSTDDAAETGAAKDAEAGVAEDERNAQSAGSLNDAGRILPPIMPKGMRAGHDISIEIALDAGVPFDGLTSTTHEIELERLDNHRALVRLKDQQTIPNKDFVLRVDVAGSRIEDAVLTHRSGNEGFLTLILQPPDRVTVEDVTLKELVFVLDTSGSMEGFPLEKAREMVNLALDHLYPQDTFNLITFAGDTHILFDQPVRATPENLLKAKRFLASRKSDGGTEMMKAIRAALKPSDALDHVRIACFLTDGEVGNDMEIISEVQKHPNARVFAMGFSGAPNRFLLDKMAEYGRGEVEYVTEADDGSAAARRFFERVRAPLLTDIQIDWAGLPVTDIYPKRIPDLFSARPVILSGRYTAGGFGSIRLKGKMSGRDFVREIPLNLPASDPQHGVLSTLWARRRIDDLMGQDMSGLQTGNMRAELRAAITELGLQHRLMTQFTSFVAVEDRMVTEMGEPRRVEVPVEAVSQGNISSLVVGARGMTNLVTVTSTAAQVSVNTSSAMLANNIETRSIVDLPLNGRSMLTLVQFAPGVSSTANQAQDSAVAQLSFNGQRPGSNAFIIDGVSANIGITRAAAPGTAPAGTSPALTASGATNNLASIEAMQEISLKTFNFDPQYGRVSGGQISIVTNSGTNAFHGKLFEFFGNDALDANDWFANSRGFERAAHRRNIFGGVLGGPVLKDQVFFFSSYEGLRLGQPIFGLTDVPSINSRLAAPAALQPFLNAFPLPTGGARPDGLAEFASSYSNPARHDAASIRLDWNASPALVIFGRYNLASSTASERGGGLFSLNTVNRTSNRTQTLTTAATINHTPRVVTDLRFNYSRVSESGSYILDQFGGASLPDNGPASAFLLSGANGSTVFDLNGRYAGWKEASAFVNMQRQLNMVGSVMFINGNHTFKLGGDLRKLSPVLNLPLVERSALFNNAAQTSSGVASRVQFFSRTGARRPVFHNLSVYGQDEWKVASRLSLTYGLRWEVNPAPSEQNGEDALALKNPEGATGLSLAPRGAPLWKTTYHNFAPRASFAYELSGESGGEMVLRGSFGLLYDMGNERAADALTDSFPFLSGEALFNVPFPPASARPAQTLNPASPLSVPFIAFDPRLKLPYTLQWHAGIERALCENQKFSVSYIGAAGHRLLLTRTLIDTDPGFAFVRLTENGASSDYQALHLQFDRRFARGLQALAAYTWSRSLDNVSQDSIYRAMLTSPDARLDRGPSDFDIRHRLAANVSYSLPALFSTGLGNALSRNWEISSIFNARSARPLNVVYAVPTIAGFAYLRPDRLTGVPLYVNDSSAGGGRRLNPAAFSVPALPVQGTFGRNLLRGFLFQQLDLGLGRKFNLTESVNLKFRVEAFNLLNHPNFEDPVGNDLSLGSQLSGAGPFLPNATFGQSASMSGRSLWGGAGRSFNAAYGAGGPRSVQFSLKLQF